MEGKSYIDSLLLPNPCLSRSLNHKTFVIPQPVEYHTVWPLPTSKSPLPPFSPPHCPCYSSNLLAPLFFGVS